MCGNETQSLCCLRDPNGELSALKNSPAGPVTHSQVQPLIPSRTGLADMASPLRARDSLIHLPFLTLQGGKEMEKAARNTLATGSMAQDEDRKIQSHLVETHEVDC